MPNKRYLAGRRFEWEIRNVLKYYYNVAIRSAGSKSPFDLITFGFNKVKPAAGKPIILDDWNFEFYFGFWQLKKSITHEQASKLVRKILNDLNLNALENIKTEELIDMTKNKKIADIIYWEGEAANTNYWEEITESEKPHKNKFVYIKIGVIYTLPKKKKS
jgi:hypothetical protein